MGFFTIQAILFKIFCHKKQKAVNKKKGFMYVKIEDIVGNIKTKKYSGILIIFVNTIKAV